MLHLELIFTYVVGQVSTFIFAYRYSVLELPGFNDMTVFPSLLCSSTVVIINCVCIDHDMLMYVILIHTHPCMTCSSTLIHTHPCMTCSSIHVGGPFCVISIYLFLCHTKLLSLYLKLSWYLIVLKVLSPLNFAYILGLSQFLQSQQMYKDMYLPL